MSDEDDEIRDSEGKLGGLDPDSVVLQKALAESLKAPLLDALPFSTAVGSVLGGVATVRDHFFLKKMIRFVEEFNRAGRGASPTVTETLRKIESDDRHRAKVFGGLMVLIDRHCTAIKSQVTSHVFLAYLAERISWTRYVSIARSIDIVHADALQVLVSDATRWWSKGRTRVVRGALEPEATPHDYMLQAAGLVWIRDGLDGVAIVHATDLGTDLAVHGITPMVAATSST